MNIPTQSGQGPTDYQSLYAARSSKSTVEQSFAQTLSSSLSLTTAEGDLVTFSGLSQSYQKTQAASWSSPASSGVRFASTSMTAEAMGLSVQGDLNDQELGDITRLIGELTSIAATFFSGDHAGAMSKAMDFGNLGLGSISSLAASFSSQTVSQTRMTSSSTLPAMADLNALQRTALSENQETDQSAALDYAQLLDARWQQILKALEEAKERDLDSLFARRTPLQPILNSFPSSSKEESGATGEPQNSPVPAPDKAQTAQQMFARVQQLLTDHPKLTPFANSLATTAMEKAVPRTDQSHPVLARAFDDLQNTYRNQLHQWLFAPEVPEAAEPLTAA